MRELTMRSVGTTRKNHRRIPDRRLEPMRAHANNAQGASNRVAGNVSQGIVARRPTLPARPVWSEAIMGSSDKGVKKPRNPSDES